MLLTCIQFNSGQITMVTEEDAGVAINLLAARLEIKPLGNPLCVEIFTGRRSYLIQFGSEGEYERWATQLSAMARTTK
jgi:hypothetical protein